MHPTLSAQNLSKLPGNLRHTAANALRGYLEDLNQLSAYIDRSPKQPGAEFLLPIFYCNLVATDLPGLATQLESSFGPTLNRIAGGVTSLQSVMSLYALDIVGPAALVDLWPRCWAWISFLDTYRESLPGGGITDSAVASTIVEIIATMLLHPQTARLVDKTCRVRVVLARAWAILLDDENTEGLWEISHQLQLCLGLDKPRNLEEAMEGAGGDHRALAALLVKHVNRIATHPGTSDAAAVWFSPMLSPIFLTLGEHACDERKFRDALLRQGIVKAVTYAVCQLCEHGEDDMIFAGFISLLFEYINAAPSTSIPQALQAGLLSAIVAYEHRKSPHAEEVLHSLLNFLLIYLVHRPVVTELRTVLACLDVHSPSNTFRGCGLHEKWNRFLALAQCRIEVLAELESPDHVDLRVCDNSQCGTVMAKVNFRRCSGCLITHYCSKDCQIADWNSGEHRYSCEELEELSLEHLRGTTQPERAFIRALVLQEYIKFHPTLGAAFQEFERRSPDQIACLRFDFSDHLQGCTVKVTALDPWEHDFSLVRYPLGVS
ncbi:hypothetical protein C8R43DRAFT_969506 [Mycena crocata]|nr:hypothetical protein C8R43DRAFT_969506 [Mycena crocata]